MNFVKPRGRVTLAFFSVLHDKRGCPSIFLRDRNAARKPGPPDLSDSDSLPKVRWITRLVPTQEARHKTLDLLRSERRRVSGPAGRHVRLLANR